MSNQDPEKCHIESCSSPTTIGSHGLSYDEVVSKHYCAGHWAQIKRGIIDDNGKPTEKAKKK